MRLPRRNRQTRAPALEPVGGRGPFAAVTRYVIASSVLSESVEATRVAGLEGDELFVAWGARVDDDGRTLRITSALIPDQRCIHSPDGVGVIIDGESLFRLNRTLYARGEILAGQAHAHPTQAYHSRADDALALVTFPGGLSLVVPDFARGGLAAQKRWRWYRLGEPGPWHRLAADAIEVVT